MTHLGLFEGIGGFSLAARWAGWETIAWCEWNEFGQKVMRHHFPKAIGHGDITQTDFTIYRGRVDIITGGFPCQPYSTAGKRLGKEDERHLWPEMLRAIREVRPRWVVGENVLGLVNWSGGLVFHEVQADLEAEGYEVFPYVLPACAVNAPHRRDRVWFVAYDNRKRLGNGREQHNPDKQRFNKRSNTKSNVSDTAGTRLERVLQRKSILPSERTEKRLTSHPERIGQQRSRRPERQVGSTENRNWKASWTHDDGRWPTQPPICSGDDGLPTELDGITFPKWRNESIKAYGNAIVPQVALQIFEAINEFEANI